MTPSKTTDTIQNVVHNGQRKGGARKPHIVLIVPRGEAVRNFLYSDTLKILSEQAKVTLLSVIHDAPFQERFGPQVEAIHPLENKKYDENRWLRSIRFIIHEAHFRWLWSEVAKNTWELRKGKAITPVQQAKRIALERLIEPLANRPALEALTKLENYLSYVLRPDDEFNNLFARLKPDLVFNCSHIHGQAAAELPAKIAHRMGIPVAGFIFSWDNLTSRSRIFVPYHHYIVWHEPMRDQLLDLYPKIDPDDVTVTGTPQFDFHFKPEYWLSREEVCRRVGLDPARPFVFYTTGLDKHFPEEHRTVERVIQLLEELDLPEKPQLLVRTYVKGISKEMRALAARMEDNPDVVFPPVAWDEKWYMPQYEDLALYTSLLRECALGINPASTVTLELMMHNKPVINLGFDPPGSRIPHRFRWIRHIHFDHFRPVAESGGTMVAYKPEDLGPFIQRGLTRPHADKEAQDRFIKSVFGDTLDGKAGQRVAEHLLQLARRTSSVGK